MFTRRRFLAGVIPGLALVTGGISVANYSRGGCPLSNGGYCVGPCSALVDRDGDLFCDRIGALAPTAPEAAPAVDQTDALAPTAPTATSNVDEAAPETQAGETGGRRGARGRSSHDSSAPQPGSGESEQSLPTPTSPPQHEAEESAPRAELVVLCPFGLVNDPYPGRCRRYIDRNGNGICDLSEPRPVGEANP